MKRKARWQRGDFVHVKPEGATDVPLDNHGRLGVIIQSSYTDRRDGWYHHVWFGPFTGDLAGINPRWNWRGCYEEWLED